MDFKTAYPRRYRVVLVACPFIVIIRIIAEGIILCIVIHIQIRVMTGLTGFGILPTGLVYLTVVMKLEMFNDLCVAILIFFRCRDR